MERRCARPSTVEVIILRNDLAEAFHFAPLHQALFLWSLGSAGPAMIVMEGSPVLLPAVMGARVETRRRMNGFEAAVRFIAAQPGGTQRILDVHRANSAGLCCGCGAPGTGSPHIRWPCPVAKAAQQAACG